MPRALVTGGGGFIGSNLARLLLDNGHEVTVLDDFSSGYRSNLEALPEARLVEGDVRDPAALARAIEGADTVFHLAASVGNTRAIERPIEDSEINVLGTLRVLEAARANGTRKVVFSSSAGIFGELKRLPIAEDHPLDPDSPYGVSKLAAEKMCLAYAKLYELEAVCLRYFNVYGPNQRFDAYGNVIPIFAHRLVHGETVTIYDDGEQTRDFVNVRDVAAANLLAARADGVSGAFNIASATQITINELVERLLALTGSDLRPEYLPQEQMFVTNRIGSTELAEELTGFRAGIQLDDGLASVIEWRQRDKLGTAQVS